MGRTILPNIRESTKYLPEFSLLYQSHFLEFSKRLPILLERQQGSRCECHALLKGSHSSMWLCLQYTIRGKHILQDLMQLTTKLFPCWPSFQAMLPPCMWLKTYGGNTGTTSAFRPQQRWLMETEFTACPLTLLLRFSEYTYFPNNHVCLLAELRTSSYIYSTVMSTYNVRLSFTQHDIT